MSGVDLVGDFTDYACGKLRQNLAQVVRCARLLELDEVWQRPNRHSNSVGNLVLHLTGNVRQWILAGIGGEPFERDRPGEFTERGPLPTGQIVGELEGAVRRAVKIISAVDAGALGVRRSIQGYDVTTQAAIFHVVEHFSLHAGQIVYATKTIRDVDLSLYDDHGRKLDREDTCP
jgi:uncharacterized damage-inducible protein DinB